MLTVKITGIVLIVASCAFFGFFKSFSVRSRYKKLLLFCDGIDLLYEYVNQGDCELHSALKKAFSKCDFLCFQKINAVCKDGDLDTEDKSIINDFFDSLGKSVKKAECDRIKCCKNIVNKRIKDAEEKMPQKCKLWQTFGVCIGLAIAILLI